ncbi:ATP-binding protein [Thermodesulfobacteriota bacterium]
MRIQNKLIIFITSIVILVVIFASYISLNLFRRKVIKTEKENFSTLLRVFAYSCMLDVDKFIESLGEDAEVIYAMVITPEGDVLVHSDRSMEGKVLKDEVTISASDAMEISFHDIEVEGRNGIDVAMPIKTDKIKWAVVRIGFSTEELEEDIVEARNTIFILALISIFFGAVISYFMSKKIVRPIVRLTDKAERITKGEREVSFDLPTMDSPGSTKYISNEVSRLVETFKIMYGSIQQKENELTKDELQITKVNLELQDTLKKLLDSKTKYQTLTESARDIIFTIDLNGSFTFINDQANEILEDNINVSMIGESFIKILNKNSRRVAYMVFKDIISGKETKAFEVAAYKSNKVTIPLELILSPIIEEGVLMGVHGIARDISYRKSLEAQLIQTGKLSSIGELSTGIAHELNQPLMIIRGYCQLINSEISEGDKYYKELKLLEDQTTRMGKIINHLKTFSRQDAPYFSKIDINSVIENSFIMVSEHLKLKDITVVKNLTTSLPMIFGDANQLEQIFLNLITNAADAMDEMGKGTLTFKTSLSDDDKEVVVSVSDTGKGISENHLRDIFNPFFTTKEVGKGTGLGLSISYGIIQTHKGSIMAKSKPGEGTEFILKFPLFEDENSE